MSNILSPALHKNENLTRIFDTIKTIRDPRTRRSPHPFESIIMILICALIGNADNSEAIAQFGRDHQEWFERLVKLPRGIPSHDTFNRMLRLIDSRDMANLIALTEKEPSPIPINAAKARSNQKDEDELQVLQRHICLDGKVLRALTSIENPATLVRAFFPDQKRTLAQQKVADGTNEIPTIPIVLHKIQNDLKGSIVTTDAIGTQTKVARTIHRAGAGYLLVVKANQGQLHEDIGLYLNDVAADRMPEAKHTYHETYDKGHGRIEIRKCWTTTNIGWLYRRFRWAGLKSISIIETTITIGKGQPVTTQRCYISNELTHAKLVLAVARNHWSIENILHWPLNVAFHEHISTTRKGNGATNLGTLRTVALALLQQSSSPLSVKLKRARAASNLGYLLEVLSGKTIDIRTPVQKMKYFVVHVTSSLLSFACSCGFI
jgi:predicted transposase YbfD/YdcC